MMLLAIGAALAGEYRQLEIADGRSMTVEVLGSEATGLVVGVPQGTMHLPYEQVLSITPVEASAYTSLHPLRILVLPFTSGPAAGADSASRTEGLLRSELGAVPATEVFALAQLGGYAPASTAAALASCGADRACLRARIAAYPVDVVIGGTALADDTLSIVIGYPPWPDAGSATTARFVGSADAQHLVARQAVHQLLGIDVPPVADAVATAPIEPVLVPPEPVVAVTPTVVTPVVPVPAPSPPRRAAVPPWVAAIPVPGATAWAGGDVAHGLAAVALVVPATAGIGFLAGTSGSRQEDVIGLTAVGWWVLCAFTNVTWMPTVTPTEGGAKVSVGSSF